jgi:hypothetical protein
MKKLIVIILISLTTGTFAQKLSFSNSIVNSTDENIITIREQWKAYIKDCMMSYITKNEETLHKYWNDLDVKNKYSSIAMYQVSDKFPAIFLGEMVTYDITKLDNDLYRLKTLILFSDSISKGVTADFNLFANLNDNKVKFVSHLQNKESQLKSYSTDHIKYLYTNDFSFNKKEAQRAEKMYSQLLSDFDIDFTDQITYIVANNLEIANRVIGFDYSTRSSTLKDAGYYMQKSNIMLSCQVAHLHELVHVVLQSKYPNAPQLFHEGIATYLGGTNGEKYKFHLKMLKEIAKSQENINFSNFNEWHKIIDDKTNPFYTIGAIFIDHAYKIGGQEKVEALFKSTEEVNDTLINVLQIENIDAFIKDYLTKNG